MIERGDAVVCIDNGPMEVGGRKYKDASAFLKVRATYKVRGVSVSKRGRRLVMLRGVPRRWFEDRFRKVQRAERGFEIMLGLRKPTPVKEKEPVE